MISVRPAAESDIVALCSLDLIARQEDERQDFIHREVAAERCFVAVDHEEVIGYGVLNYSFYSNGWIDMFIPNIADVAQERRC